MSGRRVLRWQIPVDDADHVWRGTAPRTDEGLVWHLFERQPDGVLS